MREEIISYDNLRIDPYKFEQIQKMTIENDINMHSILSLTGIIDDEIKDEYINETDEETIIEIYYEKEDSKISLFNGIVTKINIEAVNCVYKMSIEAKSFTYLMDIKKNKRDFQDINMTTHELIDEIMKQYSNSIYYINIPNEPIGEFILQYDETDYEFLKRILSKYHQGIISAIEYKDIHLFLGVPEITVEPKIENSNYTISKSIDEYNDMKNNDSDDILESDFINYRFRTQQILNLGENFNFMGKQLYLKRAIYEIDEGKLENIYDLRSKGGLKLKRIYNMNVIGISITGYILDVQRDKVKANLEISQDTDKSKACWFPYATVASSPDGGGWYCMPEVGERIRLNCPTKDESKAFVVNSIDSHKAKSGGAAKEDRMSNPDIKSLKSDSGQEVKFTPNGVVIECNGGQASVNLNKDGTVEISGQKNINLACAQNLSLRAEKELSISAEKNIDILCESGSNLIMSESDEILLTGTRVQNNG